MAPTNGYVGVKPFEKALLSIFESEGVSKPTKTIHPLLADAADDDGAASIKTDWDALHPKLHPLGAGVPAARAPRKCWQLESCIAVATLLAQEFRPQGEESILADTPSCHVVDFAGGSGPLGLPLAAMLPWAKVTIVDIKDRSLAIARERAAEAKLSNVAFFHGDIRAFLEPFDIGVALHACGDASDLVIESCVAAGARFAVCPCCTGKLSSTRMNVFRHGTTNANERYGNTVAPDDAATIVYPRSAAVQACLSAEEYNYLACAADVSDAHLLEGSRGVLRRLCKAYLEHDRKLWAVDRGYACHVTRMHRPDATPKADILYGWREGAPPTGARALALLTAACADEAYEEARRLGLGGEARGGGEGAGGGDDAQEVCSEVASGEEGAADDAASSSKPSLAPTASRLGGALAASEWNEEELCEMLTRLRALGGGESLAVNAPSARRRRLVHYAAAELGLHHTTLSSKGHGAGAVKVTNGAPLPVSSALEVS